MIDVRKLRMLAALQRLGTIAAVAAELHLSPQGVSMQLAALERELGVQLTERQGRRVVLTPAGVILAAHGREIGDRISRAEVDLDALRAGAVGRYAVAAVPSAARTIVADAWRRILAEVPALDLRLTTAEPEEALEALAAGTADLALLHAYSNVPRDLPPGISAWPIGTEPVWLAVRRDGGSDAVPPSARLEDYAGHAWITPANDVTCYDMVERACGLAGFRPRVVAESMDFAVQLALVAAGVGVALVPGLTVDRVPDGVELVRPAASIERTIMLAARAPRLADPGIRTLADHIASAAEGWLAGHRDSPALAVTT